jgi:beta-galactosidase
MSPRRPSCSSGALLAVSVALAAGAASPLLASAARSGTTGVADVPAILLGVAWYPEQWPPATWERDLTLMEEAGVRLVRIGEFAWSSMEPREGELELDWIARAIAQAARHSMVTVLGTPSDAPPAWLTQKYPDTLRVDADGRRAQHGGRRQFSYTSPRYRELCRRIVEPMAQRFGHDPNVIGWQIGNKLTEDSFDDHSHHLFQEWLHAKYRTLDALNDRWTTAYWSQTYDRWDQIPMGEGRQNPALLLEYKRFVTDQWREFVRNQADSIRALADPRQFITTNLGGLGWANRFDRHLLSRDLDIVSWDDYVGQGHLEPYRNGATHDLVRGWKRRNFWVMETQPGSVNWAPISNALDRGETRRMAWQAIGHGADGVAYWQWRSALNGQEQYHGTIVGPDGEPVPLYEEIRQVGREFALASEALEGTSPVSEVAILHDYDSRWAIEFQRHSRDYDPIAVLLDFYRPLRDAVQSVDIVSPAEPLESYRLVVAPWLNVLPEELGRHLLDYVTAGGHLVLGPRSGMKDEWNALHRQRQPGPLAGPLGGRVEQFYALLDEVPVSGTWGGGRVSIWAEHLSTAAPDTHVLMRYGASNGWLDGQPAVLHRRIGKGTLTYVGGLLDEELTRAAVRWMVELSGVRPAFGPVPAGVEVCRRSGRRGDVFVLLNHGRAPVSVELPRPMRDVLNGGTPTRRVELAVEGVGVLAPDGAGSN